MWEDHTVAHEWNAATVVAMLLLKFSTAGGQVSLTPFVIALFYSTELFFVVSFHSPVDVCWSWTWRPMLNHALLRTFITFLLLKNLLSCDETSNYLLQSEKSVKPRSDDYPPESLSRTVLKCFSKSNPEISAWKRQLHLNAVSTLGHF